MTAQIAVDESVSREVIDLHGLFEDWFAARCDESDAYFDRHLRGRIAPDFRIVMPGGRLLRGDTLFADIRQAHGVNPWFRIQVRNVGARSIGEDGTLVLATCEEWQKNALNSKPPNDARLSSALLKRDGAAPNGILWLHMHETWFPQAVVSADRFDF